MKQKLKKKKKHPLKKLEEKLASYELRLQKEAIRLDRKRKTTYIQ